MARSTSRSSSPRAYGIDLDGSGKRDELDWDLGPARCKYCTYVLYVYTYVGSGVYL